MGLTSCNRPLACRIVADSEKTDLSVTPSLVCSPFDQVDKSIRNRGPQGIELSRAVARASFVCSHNHISLGGPELGVRYLPRRVSRLLFRIDQRE